jgi:hypothetical protein
MRASDEARVWLAPHQGVERVPQQGDSVCPWPKPRQHARKFLQVHGCSIQRSGRTLHGEVCVWAEYEAPTHARPVHSEGRGPRYVQTPLITVSEPQAETDPWIFQPGFVWSTCGQDSPSGLELDGPCQPQPGDMVLFGSPMHGRRGKVEWVLDTVVVLRRRLPGPTAGQLKHPYGKLVEPALRSRSRSLLPFVGEPHERAARFSFAPCKLATSRDDGCFERPNISELFDELRLESNGARPSAAVGTALAPCRTRAGLDRFWQQLTGLVWSHGLALGADFDLPAIRVLNADRESKSAARKKRARAA